MYARNDGTTETYTMCERCGKPLPSKIVGPGNGERYGWFFGPHRTCSYSCMRALERGEPGIHCKTTEPRKIKTYKRVYAYMSAKVSGADEISALKSAGYSSVLSARNAVSENLNTPDFIRWCRENNKELITNVQESL